MAPFFGAPVAMARPSATTALLAWNAPVSGSWKLHGLTHEPTGHALAIAIVVDAADFEPRALAHPRSSGVTPRPRAANMKGSCSGSSTFTIAAPSSTMRSVKSRSFASR